MIEMMLLFICSAIVFCLAGIYCSYRYSVADSDYIGFKREHFKFERAVWWNRVMYCYTIVLVLQIALVIILWP